MALASLELSNFRNHRASRLEFGEKTNLIVGQNAAGKSNILEAIWLLATGESFRAGKIEEMVNWAAEVGHVTGVTLCPSDISLKKGDSLMVTVTKGMVQGRRVQKRLFKINGVARRRQDLVGRLPAVLFRPEDLELIEGEPARRRQFLDEVLIQVDREYQRSLGSYQKGLRQRNRLLDQIREGRMNRTALMFWDQLLVKEGTIISAKRNQLVDTINQVVPGFAKLELAFVASVISPERLAAHFEAEIALGYTLVGPHKDDFKIMEGQRDLAVYGSRGEQRMAVLWLKEAQLLVMEQVRGERPILLLDDILSELDHHHVAEVVNLCLRQQTILTTTDEALSDYFPNGNKIIRLGTE